MKLSKEKTISLLKRIRGKKGLGDVVESVAQPIATRIDRVTGLRISTCPSCSKRKERLNELFPGSLDK